MKELVRQCILARKDYIPGKPIEEVQKEYGITDIIKMASNENPFGTSPKAIQAMIAELYANASRYPVSLCSSLLTKLARYLDVKESQLYIDNGGDAVITMFGLTFFNPEDEVIISDKTFPAYENITTKMGSKMIKVPLMAEGYFDLSAMYDRITNKTKAVFICNPNNPTGCITPKKDIECFLKRVPKSVLVFLDEAYYDFADNPDYIQSVPLLANYENIIILRTFSKLMGMAGIRCGYCIANEEIVRAMMKAREPFPVNRLAQVGGEAALDDSGFIKKTLDNNKQAKQYYYEQFKKIGLKYYPTESNFICVDINKNAGVVFQRMLKEGVIVRPLESQGLSNCLRITFGLPVENERTIRALKKAIETKE